MPLKPFSAIAYFFDFYDKAEHRQYLDYLSHIITSYYYETSTSKELSFFPEMLSVFSVEELFKFVEFFPDCRVGIPSIEKLKYSREVAYTYYLCNIRNEIDIWSYDNGDMPKTLGEIFIADADRNKLLDKVNKLKTYVEENVEISEYFESLEECNDDLFQTNLFILSTFIFYQLYYDRQQEMTNFFPDIINFFGFEATTKLLSKYQSVGSLLVLKTPNLEVLRYLITTIIAYYFFYYLEIPWDEIKKTIPFYIDKPKRVLSNIRRMHDRIQKELNKGV